MTSEDLKNGLETIKFYADCDITLVFTEHHKPILSVCFKNAQYQITDIDRHETYTYSNLTDAIASIEMEFGFQYWHTYSKV